MPRFYGRVGFGETLESSPGVHAEVITEHSYFGDVFRIMRRLAEGEHLNDDVSVSNQISIVADAYANEHFHAIRYVEWSGSLWTVSLVTVQAPRLVFELGDVYNGPTPD